jgi:hypothetical protein
MDVEGIPKHITQTQSKKILKIKRRGAVIFVALESNGIIIYEMYAQENLTEYLFY